MFSHFSALDFRALRSHVHFTYGEGQPDVLKGISFHAQAGKVVAFVGETGAGKSTTAELISGYYRPTQGAVFADGHDLQNVSLRELRSHIAIVPQEVVLFNAPIIDNIRYGRPDATDDEVKEAAKRARADQFIEKFPEGYAQKVGERGIKLSVGQKQRVAIARAMLRNPEILILDEPTSALDAETERYITQSLEELMQDRTTFIIAHRLSTVRKADPILFLKDGVIAEQGTHDELMASRTANIGGCTNCISVCTSSAILYSMIPLDRNESYWMLDDGLLEACTQAASSTFSTYPRYEELKQSIAHYTGVSVEQIALTAGSDAAIQELARLYVGDNRKALLPVPTFYGYEAVLARVGANVIPVFYTEKDGAFAFPFEETCSMLESEKPEVLFLCNPNNPLGCAIPDELVARLLKIAARIGTLVILDEAYYEFSGRTWIDRIAHESHLVLLRTLSKGFGIPGARVGYVVASPEITAQLESRLLPWPIAHPSAATAITLLSKAAKVKERRDAVIQARKAFAQELMEISDALVYPSETNFLLVRVPDAEAAHAGLLSAGIRVARGEPMSRYPETKALLRNTLRIAVPAPIDTPAVLAALRTYSQM